MNRRIYSLVAVAALVCAASQAGAMEPRSAAGGDMEQQNAPEAPRVMTVGEIVANPDAARGLEFVHHAEGSTVDVGSSGSASSGSSSDASSGIVQDASPSDGVSAAPSSNSPSDGVVHDSHPSDGVSSGSASSGTNQGEAEGAPAAATSDGAPGASSDVGAGVSSDAGSGSATPSEPPSNGSDSSAPTPSRNGDGSAPGKRATSLEIRYDDGSSATLPL